MRVLILGAGNCLLSDEGFGVHFIAYLREHYRFPEEVGLCDGGTLGLLIIHEVEQAESVYIVDTVFTEGAPGTYCRYGREEMLLNRIPVKLSPHQAGLQEALLVSELRGCCPRQIQFYGVIPASLEPGTALSPELERKVPELAEVLVAELRANGIPVDQGMTRR